MRIRQGAVTISATDLANHLSCRHLTTLDLRLAKGEIAEPSWENPHLRVLQQRGLEHEKAYIASLRAQGLAIVDLSEEPEESATDATWAAMKSGAQAIVQASLGSGDWRGRADVLLRVEQPGKPSRLGNWSYEVVDCKLALETKAETILQLCLYSELLAELQGLEPEFFHVIRPHVGFEPESYRLSAFAAYYRVVKRALQERRETAVPMKPIPSRSAIAISAGGGRNATRSAAAMTIFPSLPGPPGCSARNWCSRTSPRWNAWHSSRCRSLSGRRAARAEGYTRIREQARIQLEARTEGQLKFELLRSEPGEGFLRLPVPSPGDIFLDFEGDPFVDEGGLEYLFGVITTEDGNLAYQGRWALDRAQERAAFEWFIDMTFERMARFPDLHIYHFGTYEPGAIKRLMLRYATREEEVDRLLRGQSLRRSPQRHQAELFGRASSSIRSRRWRSFAITSAGCRCRRRTRRGTSSSTNWN